MFAFANFNRRYPNNAALSKYCMESTNKSIRKLTQEYDEERRLNQGILVKKFFYNRNNNNNGNNNGNNTTYTRLNSSIVRWF